jgi:hypothetical protein
MSVHAARTGTGTGTIGELTTMLAAARRTRTSPPPLEQYRKEPRDTFVRRAAQDDPLDRVIERYRALASAAKRPVEPIVPAAAIVDEPALASPVVGGPVKAAVQPPAAPASWTRAPAPVQPIRSSPAPSEPVASEPAPTQPAPSEPTSDKKKGNANGLLRGALI